VRRTPTPRAGPGSPRRRRPSLCRADLACSCPHLGELIDTAVVIGSHGPLPLGRGLPSSPSNAGASESAALDGVAPAVDLLDAGAFFAAETARRNSRMVLGLREASTGNHVRTSSGSRPRAPEVTAGPRCRSCSNDPNVTALIVLFVPRSSPAGRDVAAARIRAAVEGDTGTDGSRCSPFLVMSAEGQHPGAQCFGETSPVARDRVSGVRRNGPPAVRAPPPPPPPRRRPTPHPRSGEWAPSQDLPALVGPQTGRLHRTSPRRPHGLEAALAEVDRAAGGSPTRHGALLEDYGLPLIPELTVREDGGLPPSRAGALRLGVPGPS